MSGLDETQGTSDDYAVVLNYIGIRDDNSCDIRIQIDPDSSNFAFCSVGYNPPIANGHRSLRSTRISFSDDFNWYFNQAATGSDSDGDLLADALENEICTDPLDADTDDDGLNDGLEDANQNGILDTGETDPCNTDSDNDGLQDGTESGVTSAGSDTDVNIFIADADPESTTSPLLSDTDEDGFIDGAEDTNANGRVDPNESDPDDINSVPLAITSVPWWSAPVQVSVIVLTAVCFATFGFRRRQSSGQ